MKIQAGCGTRVFPYATVYSTPDGTGWYCMPEIGDAVRLYFPCERTRMHMWQAPSSPILRRRRAHNPDFKSIMNKQRRNPFQPLGACCLPIMPGCPSNCLMQRELRLSATRQSVVQSQEAVDISSATSSLSISAPQRIIFQQGNTQMSLEEKLHFGGAQVRID